MLLFASARCSVAQEKAGDEPTPAAEAAPKAAAAETSEPAEEPAAESEASATEAAEGDEATAEVESSEEEAPAEPEYNLIDPGGADFAERLSLRLHEIEAAATEGKLAGHNAWMLAASALVLFMTVPGLAMFYGGLVRKKNVLGVLMQCLFLMGLMTVLWGVLGYSLAFGGDDPYVGNFDYILMNNVKMVDGDAPQAAGRSVPDLTFMVFQGMFFIITPALICGAFAERMKFSTMVVFLAAWGLLIYCPLCHWVWGGGILAYGEDHAWGGGALDFAGGTVVHISSGVSALICALLLGKRLGFGADDMRPHNLTYTALGAGMLWVGWFGFNAGSQVASDGLAANAFVVTHFSAAAGAVAWAAIEWITRGKPSVLGAASGAVAGLVCITPASGYVQPMPALLMGAAAGIVCYFACSTLKSKLGYDDSLDAFGVHGIGGTLGAVLTGIFATTQVSSGAANGVFYDAQDGMKLLTGQIVAVIVTVVFAAVGTFIILKILDAVMGLRVSQEEETQGLDLSQHGEEGYIFL
ncbi:MAG: ammonia channel protein [Planctomycetaceae bacterium]|nr:ammonia channel protein [Planctomycetaceae bacterium]